MNRCCTLVAALVCLAVAAASWADSITMSRPTERPMNGSVLRMNPREVEIEPIGVHGDPQRGNTRTVAVNQIKLIQLRRRTEFVE